MKKIKEKNIKCRMIREAVQYGKYCICILSVVTACYGFWGCLYPDLTFVKGTYRIVTVQDSDTMSSVPEEDREQTYCRDKDALYADVMNGKVQVNFRIKLLELFKNKRGYENG